MTHVVTCDYIQRVKTKRAVRFREHKASASILSETVALPGIGLSIPVRTAKAKLSALLDLVAEGQVVTITSDGKPKAVLSPVSKHKRVFTGTWEQLKKMRMQIEGPFADEIIRGDREGREW